MSTITVLCDPAMTGLLAPADRSAAIAGFYGEFVVAIYDGEQLLAVDEATVEAAGAWWRELGAANTEIRFDEREIVDGGLFGYLEHTYGITSLRNLAIAFHELARDAGKDPVEFANWVAAEVPTPAQVAARIDARLADAFGD